MGAGESRRSKFQDNGAVMTHSFKSTILAGVMTTLLAGTAMAGGFAVREQSAEGQGASFAGIAAGTDGLSSMFWNPATMSLHSGQGFVSETDAAAIIPYSRAKDGRLGGPAPAVPFNDSGNIGKFAFVPASYWTYAVNDRMTVGMAINSPFGLVTDGKDNWIGVPNGDKSDVKTYNFNPQVAYKLTDSFSVGLGAQVEYITADLSARTPGTGVRGLEVYGADDIGVGLTAGMLFQPTDSTSIGLGFRSSVSHTLKGHSQFGAGGLPGTASAKLKTPEIVTLGIRQKVNDQFTLLGGVEWANWSRFKSLDVQLSAPAVTLKTPENWKDSWYFSLGGEYAASDALTLRSGVAYEKSPVPDAFRTPRIPDNDRFWLSVGATYKLADNVKANIAYSHVFIKNGGVNLKAPPSPAPLVANFKQHLDIVSAGLTVDW